MALSAVFTGQALERHGGAVTVAQIQLDGVNDGPALVETIGQANMFQLEVVGIGQEDEAPDAPRFRRSTHQARGEKEEVISSPRSMKI